MSPKMVFVAHPMSGDIRGNTRKVVEICRKIHTVDVIPVFPSFTWRKYLRNNKRDKALAGMVNKVYFRSGFINELWLYGDHITDGMWREIDLARRYRIIIVPMTAGTKKEYRIR